MRRPPDILRPSEAAGHLRDMFELRRRVARLVRVHQPKGQSALGLTDLGHELRGEQLRTSQLPQRSKQKGSDLGPDRKRANLRLTYRLLSGELVSDRVDEQQDANALRG